jgi:hypothetical protein
MVPAIVPAERRRTPRTKVHHLVYVSLNSENGAIVLDVSQGGLGFHAAAPVETEAVVSLRFSGQSPDKIEILCELAWNDSSKRSGGLRVTALTDEFRQQIPLLLSPPSLTSARPAVSVRNKPEVAPTVTTETVSLKSPLPLPNSCVDISQLQKRVKRSSDRAAVRLDTVRRASFFSLLVLTVMGVNCLMGLWAFRFVEKRAYQEIAIGTRNSLAASQTSLHEAEIALRHKADLLSTFAAITPPDDSALQEAVDNPLTTDGADVVAIANGTNHITALHMSDRRIPPASVTEVFLRFVNRRPSSDWWFANGKLYQMVLQTRDHQPRASESGLVIVGRQLSHRVVEDLKIVSGGEVAFIHGGEVVESTLNPFDQSELARKLKDEIPSQIQLGQHFFYATTINLTTRLDPALKYILLKPCEESALFLARFKHLMFGLGSIEFLVLIGIPILIYFRHNGIRGGASIGRNEPIERLYSIFRACSEVMRKVRISFQLAISRSRLKDNGSRIV